MAGRTAGPIKTKLGIGLWTHVDPGSVLFKVEVKVYACGIKNSCQRHLASNNEPCAKYQQRSGSWHLVNANETHDRGAQAPREFEREAW